MQVTLQVGGETVETNFVETPIAFPVAPGGTLYGFLQGLYPENLLKRGYLYDAQECKAIRAKHTGDWHTWAEANYSWNQFCREVNLLNRPEAEYLAGLLLSRDLSAEMLPGGLLGGRNRGSFEQATGLPPETFLVGWLRITNRYAWLERAASQGIPDPLHDPIPPICHSGRETVERVYKQHVAPYLRDAFHVKGHVNTLDVFARAVLYAFGCISSKPAEVGDEVWERAVAGLFGPCHSLTFMCAFPGDYFNQVAQEEQSGRAAFFPTPVEVATLMGEMVQARDSAGTPEARRAALLEEVADPAVGTGNLVWPLMNSHIRGQFLDINPSMVHATRALFAMYAPWFAGSVFCADALAPDLGNRIREQARQYAIDAALAHAGFHSYRERKVQAFLENGQAQGLVEKAEQSDRLAAHIQARAIGRRQKIESGQVHAFQNMLQQVIPATGRTSTPLGKPALRQKPKPAHPAQLSLFDE